MTKFIIGVPGLSWDDLDDFDLVHVPLDDHTEHGGWVPEAFAEQLTEPDVVSSGWPGVGCSIDETRVTSSGDSRGTQIRAMGDQQLQLVRSLQSSDVDSVYIWVDTIEKLDSPSIYMWFDHWIQAITDESDEPICVIGEDFASTTEGYPESLRSQMSQSEEGENLSS